MVGWVGFHTHTLGPFILCARPALVEIELPAGVHTTSRVGARWRTRTSEDLSANAFTARPLCHSGHPCDRPQAIRVHSAGGSVRSLAGLMQGPEHVPLTASPWPESGTSLPAGRRGGDGSPYSICSRAHCSRRRAARALPLARGLAVRRVWALIPAPLGERRPRTRTGCTVRIPGQRIERPTALQR